MESPLALSANSRKEELRYGTESLPMLRVSDALPDPELVRSIAARHTYRPIGPFFPGVRAAVSDRIAASLYEPLLDRLTDLFALDRTPRFLEAFLSVTCVEPDDLSPIQRFPHFDGTESERIAVLLYLDPEERGGTAFYRQSSTGFEFIDGSRFEAYEENLRSEVETTGLPEPGYIGPENPLFARIHHEPGRFNEMIIYRGNSLHCAEFDRGLGADPDPTTGRLTFNLFLD